jgi:hypothetical protein
VAQEVLDPGQEQEARSLGSEHQIVFGVAGSAKTVRLLARARLIAGRDPDRKVLVPCCTRAMAASLATQLDEPGLRGVEVRYFLSWAANKTGPSKRDEEPFNAYDSWAEAAFLARPPP